VLRNTILVGEPVRAELNGSGQTEDTSAIALYEKSGPTWTTMTQSSELQASQTPTAHGDLPTAIAMAAEPESETPTIVGGVTSFRGSEGDVGAAIVFGAARPAVTAESASAVGQTSATLSAQVDPNGLQVSTCIVEYGTALPSGTSEPCAPSVGGGTNSVAISAVISGLNPSTTYRYRIDAASAAGETFGTTQSFTTAAAQAPPTVSSGAASAVTQTGASLAASVNPNGAAVTSCVVEYGTSLPSGTSAPCVPSPGAGTVAVAVEVAAAGLTPHTTYEYRVIATNLGGTSTSSLSYFSTLPEAPTISSDGASSTTPTGATLEGTVNPHGVALTSCVFYLYGPSGYVTGGACSPAPSATGIAQPVSLGVAGLEADTSYTYYLEAYNAGGGGYATGSFTTLPLAPTVFTGAAIAVSRFSATVEGTVNANGGSGACSVLYGTEPGSLDDFAACSTATVTGNSTTAVTADLTPLMAGTTYYYEVVGQDSSGTTDGGVDSFTTLPEAPTVTTEPASAITHTGATLRATVDPEGGTVSSCYFEYGPSLPSGVTQACVPSPGSGAAPVSVTATVVGLSRVTGYVYRVVATNAGGTTTGNSQSFTTLAYTPPEFGRCIKVPSMTVGTKTVYSGFFTTAACTAVSATRTGKYEWESGVVDQGFTTDLASGSVKLETVAVAPVAARKVTCTGETGAGQFTGAKTVGGVTLTLTGCELASPLAKCSSSGAAAGDIASASLEGTLGIAKLGTTSSADKLALDLYPVGNAGSLLVFSCGSTQVSVQGSVLVPVTANKMALTAAEKFAATKGKQKPESLSGAPQDVLEASFGGAPPVQAGLTLAATQTNEEEVELNTVE
jgi:hypothetical protein